MKETPRWKEKFESYDNEDSARNIFDKIQIKYFSLFELQNNLEKDD